MSSMLPLSQLSLLRPQRGTTVRILVWVLVMVFVVTLTSLGSDPALALGVVLAALAAIVGDLLRVSAPLSPGH
ncbi:hypothetical protein ACFQ08_14255 [Streptosporangium algeriense]|uniref:Uncharacterized protein n=1 Tax=Streptosporangium algeriense TaxID=1682748 RepID=A0ABW3DSP5_9ACTN